MQTIQEDGIRQRQSFRFHLLREDFFFIIIKKEERRMKVAFSLFNTGTDITLSFHHGSLALWLFQSTDTDIIYS